MMPDSVEGRLQRLERESSRLEQRVVDLSSEVHSLVHTLAPLVVTSTRLETELHGIKDDIGGLHVLINGVTSSVKERDDQATAERRSMRTALLALTGVIGAALITGIAAVAAAGIG